MTYLLTYIIDNLWYVVRMYILLSVVTTKSNLRESFWGRPAKNVQGGVEH